MKTSIKINKDLWKLFKKHSIDKDETITDILERIIKLEVGIGLIG